MDSPNHHADAATNTMSPITTNGNWFWKDNERFLIKGLTYCPRHLNTRPGSKESYIDPLGEAWLPELRKDIPYLLQLGINTLSISHSDIKQSPTQALQLLQEARIHVLLELFTNISIKDDYTCPPPAPETLNLQNLYSPNKVRSNLVLISQTANFPNVLGYTVSQSNLSSKLSTKLAALHRAAVRDTKLFLHKSGHRPIPVGAAMSASQMYRHQALDFMTAGEPAERVDFMSFGVWDWANKSDFRVSGYSGLVDWFGRVPVPMLFGEYGTSMGGMLRPLGEVECLFSPCMTGVFSGGCLHTFGHTEVASRSDDDDSDGEGDEEGGYDLVRIEDDGTRRPKRDYETYRQRLADVGAKPWEAVGGAHEKKDYEGWRGVLGGVTRDWLADGADVLVFPLEWRAVLE